MNSVFDPLEVRLVVCKQKPHSTLRHTDQILNLQPSSTSALKATTLHYSSGFESCPKKLINSLHDVKFIATKGARAWKGVVDDPKMDLSRKPVRRKPAKGGALAVHLANVSGSEGW